jgi:tRNA threonylcarbamoyladenosine biosynthesis protein TsaE
MTSTTFELDEAALIAWGERIGREAEPPLVLALRGDLGAGKSTLARGVARGAGVGGAIPSPTYNLVFHYQAPRGVAIAHLDLYRLEDPDEVWELGWSELPGDEEIVMIEWPERAEGMLPEPRWEVRIGEGAGADTRRVELEPIGDPAPLPLPAGAQAVRS